MPNKIIIATLMREQGETGVQTHFNMFKQYLLEREVDVVIITPFSFYSWLVVPVFGVRKIIDKLNGELSVWWYRYWHYIFLKQALAAKTRKGEPVVIYAQCPVSAKAALETRYSDNQKVIMVVHFNVSQADEWAEKGKIKKEGWVFRQIKQLESDVIPLVDGIVYDSKFIQDIVIKNIPEVSTVSSVVLPNFISKPKQSNSRIIEGDIINVGTLEPRKNQSYLLTVLSEAKKLGRRYSLTLIGDGQERRKLKAMAESLDIDEQVKFMGFQPNIEHFLSTHSVYAHSATIDNLPLTLITAMAYGLPVIAAAVGGIPEVFSDEIEGFYWPLDQPAVGAEKLIALMEDSETRNKMSKAAQKRFESNFESNVVASRLLSFLSKDAYE